MVKSFLITLVGGLVFSAGVTNAEAATVYVPSDHKTIQQAVENTLPGDEIIVKEGDYRDNIVVTKPLTIKSEKGPDATIIRASNPAEPVFKVSDVNGVAITGLTVTGSTLSGIYLHNSHNDEIRDNKVEYNGTGIYLYSSNNNILKNNITNTNEQNGIYLELSHNNTIEKNSADSNKEKGIFLNYSNFNKLLYNSASLNTWNGFTLWSSNNNRVEGNRILRNTYSIVVSNSSDNALIDNTTWTNFYIILPIILIYVGILFYWIQRRIFRVIYKEKGV